VEHLSGLDRNAWPQAGPANPEIDGRVNSQGQEIDPVRNDNYFHPLATTTLPHRVSCVTSFSL
jgi:hypothetical protein